jgi:hypothetical protein
MSVTNDGPQRPQTFNGDLANLPAALVPLTLQERWVVWSWEWRSGKKGANGKWTKPPRQASNPSRFAASNDPSTWGSYGDAVAAVVAGKADGIGFMLLKSEIAAGDLDHCRDPETGMVDAWAETLHAEANGAYREITVSGRGLRIIGIANGDEVHRKFTFDRKTGAGLELYRNTARYITISGCEIGSCAKLPPLDGFIDTAFARYASTAGGARARKGTQANGSGTNGLDFNNAGPQPSSIDYDEVIRNGAPEGQRSELFQACVWHLAGAGKSVEEIVEELALYPNGISEKYADRLAEEVARSYSKWQAERTIPGATDADPDEDAGGPGGTLEPPEPNTWKEVDKNGKPRPTCTNTRRAMRALGINCRYDVFHDKLLVESPVIRRRDNLDQTVQILRTKIEKAYGFDPGTKNTRDALIQLCLENEFDPVLDYLNALKWDGTLRLDRWLTTYTGAPDTELNREFGRITLTAAVRRARHPGEKFDPIIVLEGKMGTNKSKAIETLAGVENFSDQSIFGMRDREQQELLAGVWLYEIAELSNIRKTEVEHIKAFASRTHDRARPAYGRMRVDQPRRCVLFATTNNDRYLKEADRRFWPIKTSAIDIAALRRDRDQLWAEAAQQEREDASITLRQDLWDAAGVEQLAREEPDPWDDVLVEAVGNTEAGEERVSSTDLLSIVLRIDVSKQRDIDFKRLGRCMRRLGWDGPKKTVINEKPVKGYVRPIRSGSAVRSGT